MQKSKYLSGYRTYDVSLLTLTNSAIAGLYLEGLITHARVRSVVSRKKVSSQFSPDDIIPAGTFMGLNKEEIFEGLKTLIALEFVIHEEGNYYILNPDKFDIESLG